MTLQTSTKLLWLLGMLFVLYSRHCPHAFCAQRISIPFGCPILTFRGKFAVHLRKKDFSQLSTLHVASDITLCICYRNELVGSSVSSY